ncbi:MAG: dipeptidase [Nitrospinota bacterium]
MQDIIEHIGGSRSRYLEELKELLRIESVSADPDRKGELERCALHLRDALREMGLEADLHSRGGNPIVLARWMGARGKPTLLLYGHYDVQPPEPLEAWKSPPFEPEVRDGNIYARGASDDKGQLFCHIRAAEAFLARRGSLPLNLIFLIEGEEEVGSPSLGPFIHEEKEGLRAQVCAISDGVQFAPGLPAITYGLRGILYVELLLEGPSHDLHSGSFGGTIANPANELSALIASLKDESGRVTVKGFYDEVESLSEEERKMLRELPFEEEAYREGLGVKALSGERGFTTLERRWARPTLDVNGIWGGYMGPGSKTIIPARAGAKLSMRLVPHQEPEKIAGLLEAHLKGLCPPGLELTFSAHHASRPYKAALDSPGILAAKRALEKGFGREPVMIREGGSIPIVSTIACELGIEPILMGFGLPDDSPHGPNEKLCLEDFYRGIMASSYLMEEVSKV